MKSHTRWLVRLGWISKIGVPVPDQTAISCCRRDVRTIVKSSVRIALSSALETGHTTTKAARPQAPARTAVAALMVRTIVGHDRQARTNARGLRQTRNRASHLL